MLANLSIKTRLLLLSSILIAMILASTYFLTSKLSEGSHAVTRNAELAELIDIAQGVRNTFGEYRYWLTDLAVSLLRLSEGNAKAARERLTKSLDELERRRPDVTGVLKKEIDEFETFGHARGRAVHRRSARYRQHLDRRGAAAQRRY